VRRADAGARVLDRGAALGGRAKPSRRLDVDVGRRLPARHLLRGDRRAEERRDAGEVERAVERAATRLGGLDVVIANAGIIQVGPLSAIDAQDVADAHDAIFWAAVYPVLRAVEVMRRAEPDRRGTRGHIGIVTSIGGKVPTPHLLPYTAAKFATTGFAEALRTEVAKEGITVTTAIPGLMRTGSPRNALVAGDREPEYRWFTLLDSIPGLAMDARAAARRIVRATLAGRGEVVLTPAAKVGIRVHGVAPALTTGLLGLFNRLLPDPGPGASAAPAPGHTLPEQPGWFRALTTLTGRAAARHREYDDETPGTRSHG
jgi:NAD(P)-dependent dehydrogenase (short-subunit alcohol dehydrogenase family)